MNLIKITGEGIYKVEFYKTNLEEGDINIAVPSIPDQVKTINILNLKEIEDHITLPLYAKMRVGLKVEQWLYVNEDVILLQEVKGNLLGKKKTLLKIFLENVLVGMYLGIYAVIIFLAILFILHIVL